MTLQQNDVREPLASENPPPPPPPTATLVADPFENGGDMGAVMRSVDWARTPIGPVASWSESVRMMVRVLLVNRFPLLLWWGPEYVQLYNDAYRPVLGSKHPRSMGQRANECWPEIWNIIGPLIDTPFNGGPSTWMEDIDLEIERNGFREETHYTIAYSPVPDATAPRGIGGVLATVHEITEKVVAERRVVLLRDLGVRSVTGAQTAEAACEVAARILSKHTRDVPFALLYLIDQDGQAARLAGAAGVEPGLAISPRVVPLGNVAADDTMAPLRRAVISERLQIVEPLASRFGPLPAGPWAAQPEKAVVLPLLSSSAHGAAGVLVAGVSARLQFDDAYRAFFDVLTTQIASAVANARAYEEEAKRAEALAELDRAKTAFFSNVSHEFRTPLTLILGPAEDALADEHLDLESRQRGEIIHRNALRLLKLVNTLLDFSRIEAGRIDARYVRTDLAALTTQLASTFRSAIERAGLRLTIDAPSLDDPAAPVYVDRDMWEKIVLNLVSNAFKHTFEGEIAVAVRLAPDARHVELAVRDTGIGIPDDQVPHLFERFHRVPNARSRTHEGTGIGLALVQELVKLHDGAIAVTTVDGEGSTFTVSIPVGALHLPPDRVHETENPHRASLGERPSLAGAAYSTEAMRWLPDEPVVGDTGQSIGAHDPTAGARILLADDNADLRDYAARLLRQRGWLVDTVADGAAALEAVLDRRPDLVLSDVMMPRLDGFELVRAMRADSSTATIPVILLSARAGEEAKVEGLDFGADDYLIKPFSARELLARVGSHLTLARARARIEAEADAAREDLARANQRLQRQAAELVSTNERLHEQSDELAAQHADRESLLQRERAARAEAEEARVAAQMANRSKSAFLAAMSHELRTPLNAIAGHAQLLEMGVHGVLTDAQRGALARIQRSEQHLLALINDVLNFAKLEAGRVEYAVENVRLTDVVTEVVAMVDPQLRAKAITVDASVPRDLVVHADREKVGQVLLNLLSNAVKFTSAGGHVAIDAPERRPARGGDAASDRDPQPMAFLRVTDSGTGVPREKQALIFQPFVQLERNLKRPAEGTGLGLSISRDLAHGMGGDLRVRSVGGHGARFTLALPRASEPAGRGLTGSRRD